MGGRSLRNRKNIVHLEIGWGGEGGVLGSYLCRLVCEEHAQYFLFLYLDERKRFFFNLIS